MKALSTIRLSMLDLVAVREGGTVAGTLAIALRTAQHAERLGFTRYWLAEHHNMSGIASSATAVLVGHIAGGTQRIRVGSGGVMLPNHAPVAHDQKLVFLAGQKSQVPLNIEDADGDHLRIAILKGPRHGLVSGTGTNYFLVPKPGFVGADRFTYRVWDGTVYSDVATVTLSIQSQNLPVAPQFKSVEMLEDGAVRLALQVTPGYNLEIYSSANLADWVSVTSFVAHEDLVTVTDPGNPPSAARFYRARYP